MKVERLETERTPLTKKEENKLKNCASIESLIESQDVSYIDDENDCEAVKHINRDPNKPTQARVSMSGTALSPTVSVI